MFLKALPVAMGFVSCFVVKYRPCHFKLVLRFCIKVELNLSCA